jgi:DNA end-binding protein Ku
MANGRRHHAKKTHHAEHETIEREGARPRGIWSGTLTFGLVSIPVELYAANRPGRPGLRMLAPSGLPVRREYACSEDGKEVSYEHLVRGFEVSPGEHVVVTDEELDALAPEMSRDIDLQRFVPVGEIDPVLFERAYFLFPGGASSKAYRLLAEVMENTARAGVATFVMRGKEYLAAILAEGGILRAETLRFADEVRTESDVGLPKPPKVPAAAVKKLARAIEAHAEAKLSLAELEDPYAEKLEALAERKRKKGEDVVEVPEEEGEQLAEVVDLMAVLKRSLAGGSSGGTRSRRRAAASTRKTRARRAS